MGGKMTPAHSAHDVTRHFDEQTWYFYWVSRPQQSPTGKLMRPGLTHLNW